MIISQENAGKVTIEGKFTCAICRKSVGTILSCVSFTGVGCIRDIVVLEVN